MGPGAKRLDETEGGRKEGEIKEVNEGTVQGKGGDKDTVEGKRGVKGKKHPTRSEGTSREGGKTRRRKKPDFIFKKSFFEEEGVKKRGL